MVFYGVTNILEYGLGQRILWRPCSRVHSSLGVNWLKKAFWARMIYGTPSRNTKLATSRYLRNMWCFFVSLPPSRKAPVFSQLDFFRFHSSERSPNSTHKPETDEWGDENWWKEELASEPPDQGLRLSVAWKIFSYGKSRPWRLKIHAKEVQISIIVHHGSCGVALGIGVLNGPKGWSQISAWNINRKPAQP